MQPLGGKVAQIKLTINCLNTPEFSVPPNRLYAEACWTTFSPSKPEGIGGFTSTKLVGDQGTRIANWCVLYAKDAWRKRMRSGYKIDGAIGTLWTPHCLAIYIVFLTEELVASPRLLNTTMSVCAILHAPVLLLFFIFNNLPRLSFFSNRRTFVIICANSWDNNTSYVQWRYPVTCIRMWTCQLC